METHAIIQAQCYENEFYLIPTDLQHSTNRIYLMLCILQIYQETSWLAL